MWILLLIAFYVFGAIARLERRRIAVKYPGHNVALMVFFFLFLIPTGWILALFMPTDFSNITPGLMAFMFFGSAVWPLSGYVGYKANVLTGAGLYTVLTSMAPVVTVALAILFLGESLPVLGFFGAFLILASSLLVVQKIGNGAHPDLKRGIALSLITGVLIGLGTAFEKTILNQIELGTYFVVGWGVQAFWVAMLAMWQREQVVDFFITDRTAMRESVLFAFSGVAKSVFFLGVLSIVDASIAVPAGSFMTVIVVIASYIWHKEHDHIAQKIAASIVGIAGLLLLAISS